MISASPAPERDVTYLLSVNIPLRDRESLHKFSFDTWGVEFLAVCHIPQGWTIEAGNGPTFEGVLKGGGSLGATWLNKPMMTSLRNVALVSMFAPIRRVAVKDSGGNIIQPVTFKGRASVSGYLPPMRIASDRRHFLSDNREVVQATSPMWLIGGHVRNPSRTAAVSNVSFPPKADAR